MRKLNVSSHDLKIVSGRLFNSLFITGFSFYSSGLFGLMMMNECLTQPARDTSVLVLGVCLPGKWCAVLEAAAANLHHTR